MTLTINEGTNATRPSDLVEATKDLRFLSVGETATLMESRPTEESFTGSDFMRDLKKVVNTKP
jgi:hypothetical protein